MKIIKEIPEAEIKAKYPDLMAALADREHSEYCNVCDGTRLIGHKCQSPT